MKQFLSFLGLSLLTIGAISFSSLQENNRQAVTPSDSGVEVIIIASNEHVNGG